LNYALCKLLKEGKVVLLERSREKDRWLFKDGRCYHAKNEDGMILLLDQVENDKESFYLFDPDRKSNNTPIPVDAFTIICSSPNKDHYGDFQKRLRTTAPKGFFRYFPCWELDELKQVKLLNEQEVEDRFKLWGGIPRYVFSNGQEDLKKKLAIKITALDLKLIEIYVDEPEIDTEDQKKLSHLVVQYRVSPPYLDPKLDFASVEIADMIIEKKITDNYNDFVAHYEWCRRQKWQGAYAGHLWEHLCHYLLPKSSKGGWALESLEEKRKKFVLKNTVLTVETGGILDMKSIIERSRYFKPNTSTFPVIDAAVLENDIVYGFQVTLANRHPPTAKNLLHIIEAVGNPKYFYLIWVVDPSKENGLTTKQTIKMDDLSVQDKKKLDCVVQWTLPIYLEKE